MARRDVGKQMEEQQESLHGLPPRKTRMKSRKQAPKKQLNQVSTEKKTMDSEREVRGEQPKASTKLASGGGWKWIVPLAGAVVVVGVWFLCKEMNSAQSVVGYTENHVQEDAVASGTGNPATSSEPFVNREGTDQSNLAITGIQQNLGNQEPIATSKPAPGIGTTIPAGNSTPPANNTSADKKASPATVQPSNKPEAAKTEIKSEKKIKSKLYKVKKGDNLHKISRTYYGSNNGVERIANFNGLNTEAPLLEGKTLYIPVD
ncbi:LysM domain-containing protein [Brevibacillus laterosporus]|uniref:LysM domain-containing protein n=1 Tax=Brevibacillus laterosporus TaxID=1465 RepID=A0A518V9S2_BRELA|nr:LysM domain-containing protein [Brevibacillus laterosporus]QDX93747.1 LysM domain-containing protein [Brevibacillus laterosporus]RAP30680.1 hypothetical protein C2W64_01876 [Brevibacillus laterosporus]TPG73407.1 LysM domain-containing protein [Brevibacillus laterosporus]